MNIENRQSANNDELRELLCRRPDLRRGMARDDSHQPSVASGHTQLDKALLAGGWPQHSLIKICQGCGRAEWQLLAPVLSNKTLTGHIVLINPPTRPFAPALIQMGIDLDRLIIIEATQKADLLMSVLLCVRTAACSVVLAWQPKQPLSYTELRKCQLACCMEGQGLCFLFRPDEALQQASPAALRVRMNLAKEHLAVSVMKQRGMLKSSDATVELSIPKLWQGGFLYYKLLEPTEAPIRPKATQRRHLRSV